MGVHCVFIHLEIAQMVVNQVGDCVNGVKLSLQRRCLLTTWSKCMMVYLRTTAGCICNKSCQFMKSRSFFLNTKTTVSEADDPGGSISESHPECFGPYPSKVPLLGPSTALLTPPPIRVHSSLWLRMQHHRCSLIAVVYSWYKCPEFLLCSVALNMSYFFYC